MEICATGKEGQEEVMALFSEFLWTFKSTLTAAKSIYSSAQLINRMYFNELVLSPRSFFS